MAVLSLKPTHKAVGDYYEALAKFEKLGVKHEGAVRSAFEVLLQHCARQVKRVFVPAYELKRKGLRSLWADGAIVDPLSQLLRYGVWEAKDSNDDLDTEIKSKFHTGYPRDNIIFQEPRRAILYQGGKRFYEADLHKRDELVHALDLFFAWKPPVFDEWEKAVDEFKLRVPELGRSLAKLIRKERQTNARYQTAFAEFLRLCQASLNPNLSEQAVEEMVIQHILTERIFRKIFDIGDFMHRNVIAHEIEKVIDALTARAFSRDHFTKPLEHFYIAIEKAAETISDFAEKQKFLNTVYERFFQGFSVKIADTHGIVYTPQPLVLFMVRSTEYALKEYFGSSLQDERVHILDPFGGTGTFIVNVMQRIPASALMFKYRNELWCNEVMLMPYYVASMNIEHAFWETVGSYESFQGMCLVDTFETAEKEQREFAIFNEANSERVERQRKAPIKVIIANPPYNSGQINENDNNKNRKYAEMDGRVRRTYGADSTATLQRKLWDPYVKAIRFATDRIGDSGIVCFVNNDSFVAEKSFDGLRKHLAQDFDLIYVLGLGGNVRKNPKLSGTTHNVFGIQVGVSINLFVRLPISADKNRKAKIFYHAVPVDWRRDEKYNFLNTTGSVAAVKWRQLKPDSKHNWLTHKTDIEFGAFIPIGSKEAKAGSGMSTIFRTYSLGVSTNRDSVVYDFDAKKLAKRVEQFADDYNAELERWKRKAKPPKDSKALIKYIDDFVRYDDIKWSRNLKRWFRQQIEMKFNPKAIRDSAYRPFTKMKLQFQRMFVDEIGTCGGFFPTTKQERENMVLLVPSEGGRSPFWCFTTNLIPNLNFVSIDSAQCFPLFTYSADGKHSRENIPFSAQVRFQNYYDDESITRSDIFNYVYAVLHHPLYRTRYAENLKRTLPHIPFIGKAKDFHAFSDAGRRLAELHVGYEQQSEYELKRVENKDTPLDWRVEAMRLSKDRQTLIYNEHFTLQGIPPQTFEYRLGNRSALEWVIDQYRVARDDKGDIISDPNKSDDEKYILRLIGQVITVSLETQKIVNNLPELAI